MVSQLGSTFQRYPRVSLAPRSSNCTAAERVSAATPFFASVRANQGSLLSRAASAYPSTGLLLGGTGRYAGSWASPFGYSHQLHSLPCVTLPPYTPVCGQGRGGHDPADAHEYYITRAPPRAGTDYNFRCRPALWPGEKQPSQEPGRYCMHVLPYRLVLINTVAIYTYVYTMFGRLERTTLLTVAVLQSRRPVGFFFVLCACQT